MLEGREQALSLTHHYFLLTLQAIAIVLADCKWSIKKEMVEMN